MTVGLAASIGAYAWWGIVSTLYFRATRDVASAAMLSLRVLWGLPLLLLLLAAQGRLPALRAALRDPRVRGRLTLSAALVAVNWLLFIHAVASGRTLDASLGYYLNPLVSVGLGVFVLGESLTRLRGLAIAVAAVGVVQQAITVGHVPWISIGLAFSFGLYGLVRKRTEVDAATGLAVEMTLLLLPAAALLAFLPPGSILEASPQKHLLLAGAGLVTVVPLVLFAMGVARLRLGTVGMLQYVAPTLQFLCAVVLFDEPFSRGRAIGFVLVWIAVVLFVAGAPRRPPAP